MWGSVLNSGSFAQLNFSGCEECAGALDKSLEKENV